MKRKKLITMVLAVIMLLVMSSFSVMASDPEGGNEEGQAVEWTTADFTYSEDGTTITGLTDSGVAKRTQTTVMTLPNKSDTGVVITEIGSATAGGYGLFGAVDSTVTDVILPNQLEKIGNFVFQNNQLTKVEFPGTLKEIGNATFQTNRLTEIILPDSVTTVGGGAFATNPTIEKVKISKGMTVIPATFVGNTSEYAANFTEIEIPDGITSIGSNAFVGNSFTSVEVPSSITKIESRAFMQTSDHRTIQNIILHEGLQSIGSQAFSYVAATSIELPSTVTTLNKYAFRYNTVDAKKVEVYVSNKAQMSLPAGTDHVLVWKDSESFAKAKEDAANDLRNYKDKSLYKEEQQAAIDTRVNAAINSFATCYAETDLNTIVVAAKSDLDAIQTSRQVEAAAAVTSAEAAVESATSNEAKAEAELLLAKANQEKAEADLEAATAVKIKAEEARAAAVAAKEAAEAEAKNAVDIVVAEKNAAIAAQKAAEAEKAAALAKAEVAEADRKVAEAKAATAEAEKAAAESAKKEADEKAAAAEAAQKAAEDKALESEKQAAEAEKKATEAQNAQKAAEEKVAATNDKYSAPAFVQNLKVKAGKKKAVLTWEKAENASGYRIYRATSKDGKYKLVKTVKGADTLKYVNKKLKSGKKYYYKVRAYKKVPGGKIFSKATEAKKVKVK